MSEVSRYTSAIPPLHTVKDADVRRVLEALVNGWRTRNGETKPDSDQRFITKGELQALVQDINGGYFTTGAGAGLLDQLLSDVPTGIQAYVNNLVDAKQREVLNSPLWAELGARIQRIDISIVAEQLARVGEVQKVANDLAAEAEARLGFETVTGSAIARLEESDETQATVITGLTTRVSGAESTIISLEKTTATTATNLTQLTTRVGDSENKVTDLETTTETQAQTLNSLSTRVGDTESSISELNTTTANQANRLLTVEAQSSENKAALTDEINSRANADYAIAEHVTTQLADVNGKIAAVQKETTTISNNLGVVSSDVTRLEGRVEGSEAAIEQEMKVRIEADGTINSKYTVKIDNNGYVSGFGLMSTANNATPFSEFIVRADRFAIGHPNVQTKVPFIVEGNVVYIDTALIKDASIGAAQIKDASIGTAQIGVASVDTLRIAGNAVTFSRWSRNYVVTTFGQVAGDVVALYLPISGLLEGEKASIIINGFAVCNPVDGTGTSLWTNITVDYVEVATALGVSIWNGAVFHGNSALVELPNGTYRIAMTLRVGNPGAATKYLGVTGILTASAGKR